LEVADIFVINKADRAGVRETRRDLEQMLDLGMHEWRPLIVETIASTGFGTDDLWSAIVEHREWLEDGHDEPRRRERMGRELDKVLSAMMRSKVKELAHGEAYERQLHALLAGTTDPYRAAEELLQEP
jgi:LAO/AO transport system kinase